MLPVLQIGPMALPVWPLSIILAGWAGLALTASLAARRGINGDAIYNTALLGLVGGLIAGRVAHVIVYWSSYRAHPLEIIGLNTRAFLFWPGVVFGSAIAFLLVRRYRLSWGGVFDATGPAVLLAVAILKLGAFLAGRGVGAPSDLPWSVALWGVSRHPSQLYEMVAALAGLAWVLWAFRARGRIGFTGWSSLLLLGLIRWLLEPFRASSPTTAFGLRIPQIWGILLALVAFFVLTRDAPSEPRSGAREVERDRDPTIEEA